MFFYYRLTECAPNDIKWTKKLLKVLNNVPWGGTLLSSWPIKGFFDQKVMKENHFLVILLLKKHRREERAALVNLKALVFFFPWRYKQMTSQGGPLRVELSRATLSGSLLVCQTDGGSNIMRARNKPQEFELKIVCSRAQEGSWKTQKQGKVFVDALIKNWKNLSLYRSF